MVTNPNRQSAGTPAGGQFAQGSHPESAISLDPAAELAHLPEADDEDQQWESEFSPAEAAEWCRAADANPDFALTTAEAVEWANEEFTVAEAISWRNAGFAPHEAGRWADAGFDGWSSGRRNATAWRAAGVNPEIAAVYAARGVSAEEAKIFIDANVPAHAATRRMRSGLSAAEAAAQARQR